MEKLKKPQEVVRRWEDERGSLATRERHRKILATLRDVSIDMDVPAWRKSGEEVRLTY